MRTTVSCRSSFRPFCNSAVGSMRKLFAKAANAFKDRLCGGDHEKLEITSLPPEVQLNILSFLPPEDVVTAKEVCREWFQLIEQYPNSTQRFHIELTIKKHRDAEHEVLLVIKEPTRLMNGDRLFPSRSEFNLQKQDFWNDFLQHFVVESIVLDGSTIPKRKRWEEMGTSRLDMDTAESVIALLEFLKRSNRLSELHCFSANNWRVDEMESRMVEVMLELVLVAPLKSLQIDAFHGLREKLSPHILSSMLNRGILNWSMERPQRSIGLLTMRAVSATDVLPWPLPKKDRICSCFNNRSFIEISIKNKNIIQLRTGKQLHFGGRLNLHMTAYSAGENVFNGETRAKFHIVNGESFCIAINVRTSNRICSIKPNFFMMFDRKDVYLNMPKNRRSGDSIFFECFPFANLPTALFDPAWFNPDAPHQVIKVPLSEIID